LAENSDEAMKILTAAKIISVPWDVYKGELKSSTTKKKDFMGRLENQSQNNLILRAWFAKNW
jgi:hypothetical protein